MFTQQKVFTPLGLFVLLLAAIILTACSRAEEPTPTPTFREVPTYTSTPADSNFQALPTATPRLPTETPRPPTETPRPPTETPRPPTATPRPPTATPRPPTATPRLPTATPRLPTATPKPTAAPACDIEDVPEPPFSNLDCETWEASYILWFLESGVPGLPAPALQLHWIATEWYPILQASAQACGVSSSQFALYIHAAAEQLKEEGKPSSAPDTPIAYLIGYFDVWNATGLLAETVLLTGDCVEALALLIVMIE